MRLKGGIEMFNLTGEMKKKGNRIAILLESPRGNFAVIDIYEKTKWDWVLVKTLRFNDREKAEKKFAKINLDKF